MRAMPTPDVTALIERAIREYLVLAVTYRALDGTEGTIPVEPLAIRFNRAGHRVLWCRRHDAGHLDELIWDRIQGAVETGEVFVPQPWVGDG